MYLWKSLYFFLRSVVKVMLGMFCFFNAHDRNSSKKAEYNFLIKQLKDSMKNMKLKREKILL